MHYYDPNDRAPRRWAAAALAAYALLLAASFVWMTFDFTPPPGRAADEILVDLTEPPQPEPPQEPARRPAEPRAHDAADPVEQTAQAEGADAATQTPNPRALFKMSKSGPDEPADAGNPRAPEGEEQTAGKGPGLQPDGFDRLDQGLQGRGLVGTLPKPKYPGTRSGRVVVRVAVDAAGRVTGASFEPRGSTTGDAALVEAALEAARKARFTESRAAVQGGTITYVFRME